MEKKESATRGKKVPCKFPPNFREVEHKCKFPFICRYSDCHYIPYKERYPPLQKNQYEAIQNCIAAKECFTELAPATCVPCEDTEDGDESSKNQQANNCGNNSKIQSQTMARKMNSRSNTRQSNFKPAASRPQPTKSIAKPMASRATKKQANSRPISRQMNSRAAPKQANSRATSIQMKSKAMPKQCGAQNGTPSQINSKSAMQDDDCECPIPASIYYNWSMENFYLETNDEYLIPEQEPEVCYKKFQPEIIITDHLLSRPCGEEDDMEDDEDDNALNKCDQENRNYYQGSIEELQAAKEAVPIQPGECKKDCGACACSCGRNQLNEPAAISLLCNMDNQKPANAAPPCSTNTRQSAMAAPTNRSRILKNKGNKSVAIKKPYSGAAHNSAKRSMANISKRTAQSQARTFQKPNELYSQFESTNAADSNSMPLTFPMESKAVTPTLKPQSMAKSVKAPNIQYESYITDHIPTDLIVNDSSGQFIVESSDDYGVGAVNKAPDCQFFKKGNIRRKTGNSEMKSIPSHSYYSQDARQLLNKKKVNENGRELILPLIGLKHSPSDMKSINAIKFENNVKSLFENSKISTKRSEDISNDSQDSFRTAYEGSGADHLSAEDRSKQAISASKLGFIKKLLGL